MAPKPTLGPDEQRAFLRGLIERVRQTKQAGQTPVVVFDLDGTLLDNRPRTRAILHEVAASWKEARPELATTLLKLEVEHVVYMLQESLAPFGVTDEAALDEALAHWRRRFFVDELLHHDVPVDGAVAFARAVYEAGATVVYLTGRDLPNMSLGSWQSLRDRGFPIGVVGTELVCKPAFEMSDEVYKTEQAPLVSRLGTLVASFDNEPGNCNVFLRLHPQAASVLLDTQHSPHAPELDPGVKSIKSFSFE